MVVDPISLLIMGGVIGYALRPDGKLEPISPAMLQDSEIPFAKKIEIDTGDAHDNEEYNEAGAAIFCKNPGTPTLPVYIRLNHKEGELFELTALRKIKGPFGKFFITNAAGAGVFTLIITKGFAFDFLESEVITAGSIIMDLNDLSDVAASTPANEDIIRFVNATGYWTTGALTTIAAFANHKARHQDGGGDEIVVTALSGLLADDQHVLDAEVLLVAAPLLHKDRHDPEDGADPLDAAAPGAIDENANDEGSAHSFARSDHNHQHTAALHQNGGGAEISVAGLSGLLADDQHVLDAEVLLVAAPLLHKDRHDPEDGADSLDCAAPGAIDENANDEGSAHSFARSDHNHQHLAALHENGGGAEISLTGLSGTSADLTTHAALATHKQIATGSYAGNDAASRQIAVGFKCSMVIGMNLDMNTMIFIPSMEVAHGAQAPFHATGVTNVLHGTDGFTVTNAAIAIFGAGTNMNKSGQTYYYWAISE